MEALEILGSVISSTWEFFKGLTVPGLGVSFATFFIALILIDFSIIAIQYVFGLGGSGTDYRSGQSGRKHISENRKGDTH